MEEIVASTDILTYKLSFVDVLHVTIIAEHEQVPWHQTASCVGLCEPMAPNRGVCGIVRTVWMFAICPRPFSEERGRYLPDRYGVF